MRSVVTQERGASLVELLVSTLFVSILMAISYSFARAALMTARLQAIKSDAQEVTVMALDIMTRELRMAGFSAAGTPLPPLRIAAPDRIEVATDFNGDGDTDDSNELIGYTFDDSTHQLKRATGGASPQPFVRNMAAAGFHFAYFDVDGAEIPAGATGLALAQLGRTHRIDMTLQVEFANPDPNSRTPLRSTVSGSVCLRNQ
jgi:Tfp pilus assembly protein PilW